MEDGQLLKKENIDKIRNIPTVIVQGRWVDFLKLFEFGLKEALYWLFDLSLWTSGLLYFNRYDVVCPCTTAFELQKVFPEAEFHLVPDAGHSAKEPGVMDLLIKATDKFKSIS